MGQNSLTCISTQRVFGGELRRYSHLAVSTRCTMTFAIYLPPGVLGLDQRVDDIGATPPTSREGRVPTLYWLSGLTCTDENFCQKGGAFKRASELGLAIVCPDTSPRGSNYPGEHDSYDLGSGAGFYLNATREPWSKTYHMYEYVTQELPGIIQGHFPVNLKKSISGHSMGGHGALICALKNPGLYQSVSAFAPIVNPTACEWGRKIFSHYLGDDQTRWKSYDTCALIVNARHDRLPFLIEQGSEDEFLNTQLKLDNLVSVCDEHNYPLTVNLREGYDHSYYFIATFIESHLDYHFGYLAE